MTSEKYSFDTSKVKHYHAKNDSIINLETSEIFNEKTKLSTKTKNEIHDLIEADKIG